MKDGSLGCGPFFSVHLVEEVLMLKDTFCV